MRPPLRDFLDFMRDVAREPVVAFRAAYVEMIDLLVGPRPDLPDCAGDSHFRAQERERRRPGRFIPSEPNQ